MSKFPLQRSDDEWRSELSPERYAILRQAATERPFSGKLLHVDDDGRFACAGCGTCLLYTSPSPRDRQKSRMPSSA